ncbi:MAG: transposase [bacterium]|nr:transposase [bacterium]
MMVLQRLEGLSDREAVERYSFDARWRYAAGVGGYDRGQWGQFAHTVLVDMRARLKASDAPRRIFNVTLEAASEAGGVGTKRVLDSTPLYDTGGRQDRGTGCSAPSRALARPSGGSSRASRRLSFGRLGDGAAQSGIDAGSGNNSDPFRSDACPRNGLR